MSRGTCCALVTLALLVGGCRASADDCVGLARHVAELAEAEGKGSRTGTAMALEASCKEQQPTRELVECMMAAQSLAELDRC